MLQEVMHNWHVEKPKLLRYARRRGKEKEIKRIQEEIGNTYTWHRSFASGLLIWEKVTVIFNRETGNNFHAVSHADFSNCIDNPVT